MSASNSSLSADVVAPNQPVPPQTPTRVKSIDSQTLSTPYHHSSTASAAASDAATRLHRSDAMPALLADLESSTQNVPFDIFLGILLQDVIVSGTSTERLLERCLTVITPLCNLPFKRDGEDEATFAAREQRYKGIKENMDEYRKLKPDGAREFDRYPPFVKLSNLILELLDAEQPQLQHLLRKPDEMRILFHINDPQEINSVINMQKVTRVPDIVIIAEASAWNAFKKNPSSSRRDLLERAAIATHKGKSINIRDHFTWSVVLSSMEFKQMKAIAEPPAAWSVDHKPKFASPKIVGEEIKSSMNDAVDENPNSASSVASADSSSIGTASELKVSSTADIFSSTGSKRKAGVDSQKRQDKRPKASLRYNSVVQSASYALESMNRTAGVLKVLNMIVEDHILWIWFYDRQGALQSHGLNIIQDFPRFVALLAAFQRFNRENWGFDCELEPYQTIDTHILPTTILFPVPGLTVTLGDIIYERPTLFGRGTCVREVTVKGLNIIAGREYIIKISWPESSRLSEVEILKNAHSIGDITNADIPELDRQKVRGHLPEVICSKDLAYTTVDIRKRLVLLGMEEHSSRGPRTCRLIVFPKLDDMGTLVSKTLRSAFAETVDCHEVLWRYGIMHCDITAWNVMWDPVTKCGILNDWDLSRIRNKPRDGNLERTGTVPFLALELLDDPNFERGLVAPLYRHDCESFKWALLFLCCDEPGNAVRKWLTNDAEQCSLIKSGYLYKPQLFKISVKHNSLETLGLYVHNLLLNASTIRAYSSSFAKLTKTPVVYNSGTDDELYNAFISILRHSLI